MKRQSMIFGAGALALATVLLIGSRCSSSFPSNSPTIQPSAAVHSLSLPVMRIPEPKMDPRYTLIKNTNLDDYKLFLNRNRNRPMAYAAVFDLTQDEGFLREALKKFPRSADLLARAAWISTDIQFALESARSLRDLEPKNPIGDYLTAMLLIRGGGSSAEAKTAILEGIQKGPPDTLDSRAITTRREALESAGESAFDARIHSLYGPISLGGIGTHLRRSTNLLIEGDDYELIAGVAGMAQHFYQEEQHSMVTLIGAAGAQLDLLNKLPAEYEFGESGMSVHEQATKLEKEANELLNRIDAFDAIYVTLSEAERVSYADNVLAVGESRAMKQILQDAAVLEAR